MKLTFESVVTIVALCLLSFLCGAVVQSYHTENTYKLALKREQCEESLPRDRYCEIVVTAQIKEKAE